MSEAKIWLSSPHMGGTEQSYVNEAFETNWVDSLSNIDSITILHGAVLYERTKIIN